MDVSRITRRPTPAAAPPEFRTADELLHESVSTGVREIDDLLGGGLEFGQMYLFYGHRSMHDDVQRMAVHMQLAPKRGGCGRPTIIIDSANIISTEHIADCALQLGLEPESVMERIYITRAFNSSQTYELVMGQLKEIFQSVPDTVLLIVAGLPDLFITEGMTTDATRDIARMAARLKTFTLAMGIITIVSAPSSQRNPRYPAGGRALASSAQIHIYVRAGRGHLRYTLAKHPSRPVREVVRPIEAPRSNTLPLSYFLR